MAKRIHRKWNPNLTAWLLLAPALLFLITFTIFPIVRSLYLSLTKYTVTMPEPQFNRGENYSGLAQDELFWKTMGNTLKLTLMTVIPSMAVGLLMALAVNGKFRGVGFLRTSFFYPVVLPMIVIASVWNYIFMARQGLLDSLLQSVGLPAMDVLSGTKVALPALAVLYVWREAGYLMIFYLSGLQNIDDQMYDAARIDGASNWVLLKRIALPLLMPTVLFVSTIALTDSVTQVDPILMMTNGGPDNSTATLMFMIYKNGFVYFNQGIASTLTVILLLVMLFIAMLQFVKMDKKIYYN